MITSKTLALLLAAYAVNLYAQIVFPVEQEYGFYDRGPQ